MFGRNRHRVTNIHWTGAPVQDKKSHGMYNVPYRVDLSCGCTRVEIKVKYPDRDLIRGNEKDDPRMTPRSAKCPNGHLRPLLQPVDPFPLWFKILGILIISLTFLFVIQAILG